jgi:hypothetical protein
MGKETSLYWCLKNNIIMGGVEETYGAPNPYITISDPDGWNRADFVFSFYKELITEKEFTKRLSFSTCLIHKKEKP